jgi:hypothetical protein
MSELHRAVSLQLLAVAFVIAPIAASAQKVSKEGTNCPFPQAVYVSKSLGREFRVVATGSGTVPASTTPTAPVMALRLVMFDGRYPEFGPHFLHVAGSARSTFATIGGNERSIHWDGRFDRAEAFSAWKLSFAAGGGHDFQFTHCAATDPKVVENAVRMTLATEAEESKEDE